MHILILLSAFAWLSVLAAPWLAWLPRERLEPEEDRSGHHDEPERLAEVCALVPARDEAEVIGRTLQGLARQAGGLRVIVIDDESTDGTAALAAAAFPAERLTILRGASPPPGWSGKLWALEQGLREAGDARYLLLLDADIELAPGMVAALLGKLEREPRDLVSLMATLRMETFWEKMLAPAFVYFFKLLYPFALSNSRWKGVAAAAGGCILVRREMLEKIGAFASIRGALIDDCTLARRVKEAGGRIWLGLSHSVRSHRPYPDLASLWNMVARNAFTQLRYSPGLLLVTTAALALVFFVPCAGLFLPREGNQLIAGIALAVMGVCYLPTLLYYRRSPVWMLALPLIGALYLGMTWSSALRYWRGQRSQWKGRMYKTAGA